MLEYGKIETLFNRNDDFKVIEWDFRNPAFDAVEFWNVTEKVDGINVRIDYRLPEDEFKGLEIAWAGRSASTVLSAAQTEVLKNASLGGIEGARAQLEKYDIKSITIYGELYGAGIQKNGAKYSATKRFIMFDVLINDRTWLDEAGVSETAEVLGLERVELAPTPLALFEVVELVKFGIYSDLALENTGEKLMAEGVVMKPLQPLQDVRGRRLVAKLKTKDFVK